MITYATPEEARDFAEGLTEAQLRCRERFHGSNMKPFNARLYRDEHYPTVVVERVLRCPCKVRLVQWLDSRGHVVVARYDYSYSDGYLARDLGRIVGDAKDAVRNVSVQRELKKHGVL